MATNLFARARRSFILFDSFMISISDALKIIKREIAALDTETVDLYDSTNRILAENIKADMDLPPFDRSQMDGFAVRVKDLSEATDKAPVKLKIIGESIAGKGFDGKIEKGETVRIMTGARVPQGANSVQKKEVTNEVTDGFVEIYEPTEKHQNIVLQAAEIEKGDKVLVKGEKINERMIAVLASFGYAKVKVFQKSKVSIIATGSEIVHFAEKPQKDQIRDSNSISLKIFAENCGALTSVFPLVSDDLENLAKTIERAAQRSNIVILSGGVSVGDYDFTKPALRNLGAQIFFEKIALRPGKPAVFAKLNDAFIFGLPGNPVSVAVTFYLFVFAAISQMQNSKNDGLKRVFAVSNKKLKGAKERDSYLPAKLIFNANGQLSAEVLKWGGSSDFVSFSRADCLVFVPQSTIIEANQTVEALLLP